MVDSSQVGARFEQATLKLFQQLLPLLGFEVVGSEVRRSGTQKGFDLLFQTTPGQGTDVRVNFFVECKGAKTISQLPIEEFGGKPDQLVNSRFNPDYWILFSPLRYLSNELQENLQYWRRQYPFALLTWVRDAKDGNRAGLYLDLFKFFPETYETFREDIPDIIRDQPPEIALEEVVTSLQSSIKHAYDEFEDRVVLKGLLPGVRRITPQSVYRSREADRSRLNRIRRGYYMLNSSDRFVWKVVCNDIDVRNQELTRDIDLAVQNVRTPIDSLWILGAPGCGKTTQMNRSAVDFAVKDYPVVLINSLELDETTRAVDYEEYLKKIYAIHNSSGCKNGNVKPLLVFIDNPAARLETIVRLLDRFDGLEENFRCVFMLYERAVRYHQAEEESFLPDFVEGNNKKIYVDHRAAEFKRQVFESFAVTLDLQASERGIAEEAFTHTAEISIAEAVINFCKRTHNNEYRRFAMDWIDFDEVVEELKLGSLSDLYKLISIVYQFGIALPISLLPKLLSDFNENQFLTFQDFFATNVYENLPVIIEGKVLRARHELISQWHVQEKLSASIGERLVALLRVVDIDDALERSVLTSLLGRKQIVRRYFTKLERDVLETIQDKAADHPLTQRIVMMMTGWSHVAQRQYLAARNVFRAVMKEHPRFLPSILEAAKVEFVLNNSLEAELLLHQLLILDANNLHARTELAKVYQVQKRYAEAESVLKESLVIDPNQLHPRTELARTYIKQGLFRRARAEIRNFLEEHSDIALGEIAHSILAYLNACYLMKRYQEGVALVDNLHGQFVSPELSEEYGRLLRSYDLSKAVNFFQNAITRFSDASRLLSEAAVCFKLAGLPEAETVLARAIKLNPGSETKYRRFFDEAAEPRSIDFALKDCVGIIEQIDENLDLVNRRVFEGLIRNADGSFRFWSNRYGDELFGYLKGNDTVFFDLTSRGQAINIEPVF